MMHCYVAQRGGRIDRLGIRREGESSLRHVVYCLDSIHMRTKKKQSLSGNARYDAGSKRKRALSRRRCIAMGGVLGGAVQWTAEMGPMVCIGWWSTVDRRQPPPPQHASNKRKPRSKRHAAQHSMRENMSRRVGAETEFTNEETNFTLL